MENRLVVPDFALTRRQLLGRLAGGFGTVALSALLDEQARAVRRGRPECRTTRRGRSGSSSCSCRAARRRWTPSTPSRGSCGGRASGCRCCREHQQAARQAAAAGQRLPVALEVRQARAVGHRRQRAVPATSPAAPTTCACIRSMCCDSFFHAQGTLEMMTGSGLFLRPVIGSWLLYGLGTENRNLPGFVVLGDADRQRRPGQGVRLGVPAGRLPGHAAGQPEGADPQPAAATAAGRAAGPARPAQAAQRAAPAPARRGERARRPHRDLRAGLPHADRGGRGVRRLAARRRRPHGSTASTTRRRPTTARSACWPAGWSSAASASWSSTTATGTSTATCSAGHAKNAARRSTSRSPACSRT